MVRNNQTSGIGREGIAMGSLEAVGALDNGILIPQPLPN